MVIFPHFTLNSEMLKWCLVTNNTDLTEKTEALSLSTVFLAVLTSCTNSHSNSILALSFLAPLVSDQFVTSVSYSG